MATLIQIIDMDTGRTTTIQIDAEFPISTINGERKAIDWCQYEDGAPETECVGNLQDAVADLLEAYNPVDGKAVR